MAIEASAVARVLGIDVHYSDLRGGAVQFLPQHIAIVAQGASASAPYPMTPYRITSAAQAAARYGFGSPIHLAALQLFPITGGGVGSIPVTVYPLEDDYPAGLPAVGSITPSGAATVTATYRARIAGIWSAPFTAVAGDNVATICDKLVAAINAVLEMPVIAADGATDVDLTAKWDGASANGMAVEVLLDNGEPTDDVTFTVSAMASGAADPDLSSALDQLGNTWITLVINGLGPSNTTALGDLSSVGEGRWGQLVRKPFVAFTGNNEEVVGTATTVTNARTTDRVNCQVVAPGSPNLPVQIAAAHVREIAKVANDNPPTDYGSRVLRFLTPGADGSQWDYAERDQAVKAGSSTIEVRSGLPYISDVVTMYHPVGEVPPAYRHVVDIIKIANIIYNVELAFAQASWDGAPLIPDDQPTVNPNARKPSTAKAAINRIIDSLALNAVISNPAAAKESTVATIDAQNPKRLNVSTTVQLSGNTNVISIDLNFGFFFGSSQLAA